MDVFISYAREDAAIADRLYRDLVGVRGITPWLDSKKLLPGERWKLKIMDAVKRCDFFIVLLSNKSVSKQGFVQHEIREALDKLKSYTPDNIFILPARIEECIPKHPELHEINWVDLFPSWKNGVRLILQAIEQQTKGQVSVPSTTDDTIIETINSQEIFERRIRDRGELRGCDSMELGFIECDFKGAILQGSSFVRCEFRSCNFSNAELSGVNFEGAKFIDCTVSGADFWGVNFWGADIRGIKDLELAKLEQTNFFMTRLSKKHDLVVNGNIGTISFGDYGTFVEHFRKTVGMNEKDISSTFVWLNQRYFRQMFGSNSTAVSNKESKLAYILSRAEKGSRNL